MTHRLIDHAHLFELPGPWTTIYAEGSTGTVDGLANDEILPRSIAPISPYPSGALEQKPIAALLRWPTGPDVPAAV
ncbi:hypothetical protein ACX80J_15580 [Arthrobacter sp. MDB2-24]